MALLVECVYVLRRNGVDIVDAAVLSLSSHLFALLAAMVLSHMSGNVVADERHLVAV